MTHQFFHVRWGKFIFTSPAPLTSMAGIEDNRRVVAGRLHQLTKEQQYYDCRSNISEYYQVIGLDIAWRVL